MSLKILHKSILTLEDMERNNKNIMLLGTQRINAEGHLEVGGCDTVALAKQFGTPLYVVDEAAIRSNCRRYKAAFDACYPENQIYYASKAFLNLAISKIMEQEGFGMDVASGGELYVALQAGFPVERIAMHGSNKSLEELTMALDAGVGEIMLDNLFELDMLTELAGKRNQRVNLMVRTAPGVDPKTHRLIRTGQSDSKFGLNIADGSAMIAIKRVLESPLLNFSGIHCHIGSQLLDADTHQESALILVNFMDRIRQETGAIVERINIGGGLGVTYLAENPPVSYQEFASAVTTPLKDALQFAGLPFPTLLQEPGRSLVGEAGVTLYSIGAIKTVPIDEIGAKRTYVSIDGGMSDNPRPQLYGAKYECLIANKANQNADTLVTIAGKHCETDILIWDVKITEPVPNDILAVQTTGAYNHAMASNYNRFLRPAVVLVQAGEADIIVERETYESLIANERVPARLQTHP